MVFNLKPPTNAICGTTPCAWTETPLYQFTGGTDGYGPTAGDLAFDQTGNIYGVTEFGGSSAHGNVYELTPSGGTWTANVLYSFGGGQDGEFPYSGVTFDQAGNLDGTTRQGGGTGCLSSVGCGTVFQLAQSDSGWTENILYRFQGEKRRRVSGKWRDPRPDRQYLWYDFHLWQPSLQWRVRLRRGF